MKTKKEVVPLPVVYKTPEGFDEAKRYADPSRKDKFAGFLLSWRGSKGFVFAPKFSIREDTNWFEAKEAVKKDGFTLGETIENLVVRKNVDLINQTVDILKLLGFDVDGLNREWLWCLFSHYSNTSDIVKVDEDLIDTYDKGKREACARGVRAYRPLPKKSTITPKDPS